MPSNESVRGTSALTRLFLVLNSVLLISMMLTGYFLLGNSFYTGNETLPQTVRDNLLEMKCGSVIYYFKVYYQIDSRYSAAALTQDMRAYDEEIVLLDAHFDAKKTNFLYAFYYDNPQNNNEKTPILTNCMDDTWTGSYVISNDALMQYPEIREHFGAAYPNLRLEYGVRDPMTVHDDLYYSTVFYRFLHVLCWPLLALFLVCTIVEGWLCAKLFSPQTIEKESEFMRGIHRTPMYLLAVLYAFCSVGCIRVLQKQLPALYARATFTVTDNIRPTVCLFLLTLSFLIFLTTVLASTVFVRLSAPQWWKQSVFYRAANVPQSERWVGAAAITEIAVFLVLFLFAGSEDGRLYLLSDLLFMGVLMLLIFFRVKTLSTIFHAVHRIAQSAHGTVPTKGLRGRTLQHVEDVNFLSESALEQMQRRYVNESFSTELINSVSRRMREPLTAVTDVVSQLQSGLPDEARTRSAIEQVNRHSQELKKVIEDLLRIANASAGNVEVHCIPTDARMMIEQTVGEYCDRFRRQGVELTPQTPDDPVHILADGACMWTTFEAVLDEFLSFAVRGTRVFLHVQPDGDTALFRFTGTVRRDTADAGESMRPDSLALPTAKVFSELQSGTFTSEYADDILRVELRFPLCGDDNV